jgi:tRNA threonylcarbamoyladenosine biosynthesis protein TsaE
MEQLNQWETEYGLEDIDPLVRKVWDRFGHLRFWLLEGTLGAGKTTFIQHLAPFLGIEEEVVSPTFSLVNEYRSTKFGKVYHLDLYRLKHADELSEIGLYEIEETGYFCLIEWASAVGYLPPPPYLEINLEHIEHTKRRIRIRIHEN